MSIKSLHNDIELLVKVAEGDQLAFKIIYNKYHKKVYTFSLWYLKSEADAEEVVQESFLKLWRLGVDAKTITNLEGYLRSLTRNRCLDILKRKALESSVAVQQGTNWQEEHNETEEQILLNDTRKILNEAINLLPQQQKLVYQLCSIEGLKNDEVAKQLNLSPLTVRTHMKLALKFLRSYVSKHTDVAGLLIIFKLF